MDLYKVANYYMRINSLDNMRDIKWKKFYVHDIKENITISSEEHMIFLDFISFSQINNDISIKEIGGFPLAISIEDSIFLVDLQFKRAYALQKNEETSKKFLCYMFYGRAIRHKIIQLHSSLVDYRGHGLMFLGPSGIGKTTQAELWAKYRDALIINGDVVFVQVTNKSCLGWGTPWHGSSPYCENINVPVHAMIVLKQSLENSIRELAGFEKVTAVSNNVFYPTWLENGTEFCLETLDHLLSRIPVYELSCRPDEDAICLTEETIFGKSVI